MKVLFTKLSDSLQTAITASTENRKQAQEQSQEQQRNLINLQHDLSQVRKTWTKKINCNLGVIDTKVS